MRRLATIRTLLATSLLATTAMAQTARVTVVEFYHAGLDHYFVTPIAGEIDALDRGALPGWTRTGRTFAAWPDSASGGAAASPVCRFYIPPDKGNSHFFSASPAECADVARRATSDPAFAGFVLETSSAFFVGLPQPATGACASGSEPVYRLWNRRADANHRYTSERSVRGEMLARGWTSEGFGADGVVMCAPSREGAASVHVTAATPFAPGCSVAASTPYVDAEVEPYLAVNPRDPLNLIAVWQQDRWPDGGARGLGTGVSFDGGRTWERRFPPFTRCAGGNAGNGGDFERASDPWVTFGPDGVAWQSALALTGGTHAPGSRNAITVSRSTDSGRTWSNPHALIVDGEEFFNDKEAIAADPNDGRFVYVAWDRLRRDGGGPTYFARTTDGGATWEAARELYDPGTRAQTVNNIPLVTSDGTLIVFYTHLAIVSGRNVPTLQLMRSRDRGATFDAPITIARMQPVGARDPETGAPLRDASILGSIAAGPGNQLAVVWQDARFAGGARDGIALARSFDGGLTWTTPVRINREPRVTAFIPTVAIRGDGTLGVSYFDFRSNTSLPGTLLTDYWLARSADGVTWQETRLADPFDFAVAPIANALFVGDYMSLATRGNEFLALYATANERADRNRTDIYFAVAGATTGVDAARKSTYASSIPTAALTPDDALAARIDAAVRAGMQRRLPGWRSPAVPLGPEGPLLP